MFDPNWNWKSVLGGMLSALIMLTLAGGLVSCEAPEGPAGETEEQENEGYNQPAESDDEEEGGEDND